MTRGSMMEVLVTERLWAFMAVAIAHKDCPGPLRKALSTAGKEFLKRNRERAGNAGETKKDSCGHRDEESDGDVVDSVNTITITNANTSTNTDINTNTDTDIKTNTGNNDEDNRVKEDDDIADGEAGGDQVVPKQGGTYSRASPSSPSSSSPTASDPSISSASQVTLSFEYMEPLSAFLRTHGGHPGAYIHQMLRGSRVVERPPVKEPISPERQKFLDNLRRRYADHQYKISTANVTGRAKPGFVTKGGLSQDRGVIEVRHTLGMALSLVVTVLCCALLVFFITPGPDVHRLLLAILTGVLVAAAELYFLLRDTVNLEQQHDEKSRFADMKAGRRKIK